MTEGRTFRSAKGIRFKIADQVLVTMREYVQDKPLSLEAGGVLLGRQISGTNDFVVDSITTPTEGDMQQRFRFRRGIKPHQQVVDRVWMESDGTCNYLGEWHSHPEAKPEPSKFDILNWRHILANSRYFSPHLFFVIVGWEEVGVWCGERAKSTFDELERVVRLFK